MAAPLRFDAGDYVECSYQGKFVRGIITMQHYSDERLGPTVHPYQVRLLEHDLHRLIFVPVDRNDMVRRAEPPVDVTPRFQFGDRVEMCCEKVWVPAWVTQLNYTHPTQSLAEPWSKKADDGSIVVAAPYQVRVASPVNGKADQLFFIPVDDDALIRRVAQAPQRKPLRYAVGTSVECQFNGGWAPGVVVRQWYTHPETDLRKPMTEYRPDQPEGQRIVLCAPYQVWPLAGQLARSAASNPPNRHRSHLINRLSPCVYSPSAVPGAHRAGQPDLRAARHRRLYPRPRAVTVVVAAAAAGRAAPGADSGRPVGKAPAARLVGFTVQPHELHDGNYLKFFLWRA
jgi:hypothetical protein